MTFITRTSS